jgi:hypothetical protein
MKSIEDRTLSATEDEEYDMGDRDDLPICRKKMQLRRLHGQNQPLQQMDEMIEDIRRLMLRSIEIASKERLSRRKVEVEATTTKQWKQQQQQGSGVDEQLPRIVWDPRGFQQLRWEAHENKLMNFIAEEYDAGASLHTNHVPASQPTSTHTFNEEKRLLALSHFKI